MLIAHPQAHDDMSADAVTRRLHIGGLTPSITPDHLRDRFKSFGTVTDVEQLGLDALGG